MSFSYWIFLSCVFITAYEVMELAMISINNKIIPKPGILSIPKYVGGKNRSDGFDQPIKLSANENPYGPSPRAIKAFLSAKGSLGVYPDGDHSDLRKAIAEVMVIDSDKIICGAGSDEILHFLCQCYAGQDDEVIYTEHGFAMYRISALAVGAKPIEVLENNRHADIPAIIKACNNKTKLIFLANPNNPTGTFIEPDEINKLAKSIPDHTLLVIDGAYAEYIKDFDSGLRLAEERDNVFITRTFSKIYGLGSLRVGWGYGPKNVIDALKRVKGPFNLSTAAQVAATAAIRDTEYVHKCREDNLRLREYLSLELKKINIHSDRSFANFLLLQFFDSNVANSADKYLNKNAIIVRNVSNYKLESYLRISVGTSNDCKKVIEILKNFQEERNAI